jgi:hypothetical protein
MDSSTASEPRTAPHSSRRAWLILAGLALAALGLSREVPSDPLLTLLYLLLTKRDLSPFGAGIGAAIGGIGLIFALALAFLLGFGLRDAYRRRKAAAAKRIFKNGRNSVAGTAAILLIAFALFLGLRYGSAYLAGLQEEAAMEGTHSEALPQPLHSPKAVSPEPYPGESAAASEMFARLAALAFLAGLGAMLAAMAYRRLRHAEPGPAAAGRSGEEALARGLALARRRLHVGDRDADAIIDCYADMCELFQQGGGEARATLSSSLTAREFEALLRSRGAGESQIHELTLLFEKARYSGLACDARDRRRASEALRALESRYRAGVAPATDSTASEASIAGTGTTGTCGPGDTVHG